MTAHSQDGNGRTHEPNLRELTSELDGLRSVMEAKLEAAHQTMNERDRRYEDRFTAMDEKTSLALTASEKAVVKAETATEKRFDAVNEFRGQLADQAANLLPRGEASAKFLAFEEKLVRIDTDLRGLRESRSQITGDANRSDKTGNQMMWAIGLLVAIVLGVASLALGGAALFRTPSAVTVPMK